MRHGPVFAAALAAVSFAAVVRGQTQGPAFSTKVEAVRVDVLVTDKGQPVRGLGPADFEILDNGVPQQVDLVSVEQIPLKVVLALDMSDSVAGERLDHLRAAGQALLNGLKKEDQAALVTFRSDVTLDADLSADPSKVLAALDQAEPAGETALVDGAYAANPTSAVRSSSCSATVSTRPAGCSRTRCWRRRGDRTSSRTPCRSAA